MLGMMEAILFACGDPIDIDKLAQALNTEEENVLELSRTLQAKYNNCLLYTSPSPRDRG